MGVSGFLPHSISLRAVPQVESDGGTDGVLLGQLCSVVWRVGGESPALFHMNFAQSLLSESPCHAVSDQALL